MEDYIIYCWTNIESGKKYVGYTKKTCESRLEGHLKSLQYFGRALRKHGVEAFTSEIIESGIKTIEEACEREVFWIAKLQTLWPDGYNLRPGGNGNHNIKGDFKLSEETRKAMSIARKDIKNSPHSEETKKKISDSLMGKVCFRKITPEQVQAIRNTPNKTVKQWCEELGVSNFAIYSIKRYKTFPDEP